MRRYIALDTETGGLTQNTSLLTLCIKVLDQDFNVINTLDMDLKPDTDEYVLTAKALEVNKINIKEHDKTATRYKDAKSILYNFLDTNSQGGLVKLIPIGQNVTFDILKIKSDLISSGSWEKFVSYRVMELGTVTQTCQILGLIPDEISTGLSSIAGYLKIDTSKAHTSSGDVDMTILVLKKLLGLLGHRAL